MEVNKISQIIALCDSIPVMLDTKILDAESAIKTLALIRQIAEEAHKTYRYANRKDQDYRLSNIDNPIFDKFEPKVIAEWVLNGDVKCLMKGLKQIKKPVSPWIEVSTDVDFMKGAELNTEKKKPGKATIKRHLRDATHKFVLYQVAKLGGVRWSETDDDLYRDELIERGYTLAEAE
ncbi:hypothetical protein NJX16_003833 [Salmonella enterica]|nr:hypothetical protein [Salmonella enterica]